MASSFVVNFGSIFGPAIGIATSDLSDWNIDGKPLTSQR
jgi:hypothetical protein